MNLRNIYKVFILSGAVAFFASCADKNQASDNNAEEVAAANESEIVFNADQYRLAGVELGQVQLRKLSGLSKLTGTVEASPASNALVSAPLGGYVKGIKLLVGQQVKKGQVLAWVENKTFIDLQKEYLVSKSQFNFLEKEYERQQALRKENVNSKKKYQQVKADLESTKATLMALKQTLKLVGIKAENISSSNIALKAPLYAPISGVVKSVNVQNGAYVDANVALFALANNSDLMLNLKAFEKDVNAIHKGQEVAFSLSNGNGFEYKASVKLIGKSLSADRTIDVICEIAEDSKENLVSGMYAKAWLSSNEVEYLSVPNDAIVKYQGSDYIIGLKAKNGGNYVFELIPTKINIVQGEISGIELPGKVDTNALKVVVKNAYTVVAAKVNSEEEE